MQNRSILQIGIKYGIISGLTSIVYTVLLYVMGEAMNMFLGTIGIIIMIAFLVMGMREYKKEQNGFLEYKEGLGIGMLIVTISGVLSQIFNFIYVNYIDPSVFSMIEEKTRSMMEKFGMDEDKIDEAVAQAQKSMASPMSILNGILFVIILGLIISLIVAAIMQKKKSELDTLDAG